MNRVEIIGRLTRDPEIRYAQNGETAIGRFGIAVDRRGKEQKADFFNVTAFNKTAQFAEKYLKKGTKIALCGHLQLDEYTNKDGQKVSNVIIIADELEFCEKKQEEPKADMDPKAGKDGFMPIPDNLDSEELPFNF